MRPKSVIEVEHEIHNLRQETKKLIDEQLELLDVKIKKLKKERTQLLKDMRKFRLTEEMVELYEIIKHYPGISKVEIQDKMQRTKVKDYNNTMTSLRRKGMIINMRTRNDPKWFVTK